MEERQKRKPKPKFDPKSGKWVVRNWDGTVSGITNGHLYSFDDIGVKENLHHDVNSGTKVDSAGETISSNDHVSGQSSTKEECNVDRERPFAKVGIVMHGSPAQEAGLRNDDLIIKFGTVDVSNNRNLQALPEIVRNAHSDGNYIVVVVSRMIMNENHGNGTQKSMLQLKLRPKEWSGKGLVGCVFEPVT